MSWGNSEGAKGRCDSKCHEAVEPECDCMCGGYYHGSARDGSLNRKMEERGQEILEKLKEEGLEASAQSVMF